MHVTKSWFVFSLDELSALLAFAETSDMRPHLRTLYLDADKAVAVTSDGITLCVQRGSRIEAELNGYWCVDANPLRALVKRAGTSAKTEFRIGRDFAELWLDHGWQDSPKPETKIAIEPADVVFPAYTNVIPPAYGDQDSRKVKGGVGLDPKFLARLQLVQKAIERTRKGESRPGCKMTVGRDSLDAVRFDFFSPKGDWTVVIMPMRM
jgi:hypothetical protein